MKYQPKHRRESRLSWSVPTRPLLTVLMTLPLLLGPVAGATASTGGEPIEPRQHRPLCTGEDSTVRGGCVWSARDTGNGTGRSYILRAGGGVWYISHARAHRIWRAHQ